MELLVRRCIAVLIDQVIVGAVSLIILLPLNLFQWSFSWFLNVHWVRFFSLGWIVMTIISILYEYICLVNRQKTIGKALCSLQIRFKPDVTHQEMMIRTLIKVFSLKFVIINFLNAYIWVQRDPSKSIHDYYIGSSVWEK